jgi:hypothetical protein
MTLNRSMKSPAFALVLLFALSSAAHSLTLVSLSGSGDLTLSATGTIYFDASSLSLDDIVLSAEAITIGSPFPTGVADAPTATLGLLGVGGATSHSFDGDVFFDSLVFAGSLNFSALSIHVSSGLEAAGTLTLIASNLAIDGGGIPCGAAPGGGIVVSLTGAVGTGCTGPVIGAPGDGTLTGGDGGGVSAAVPEPSAALLFATGLLALAINDRRRGA